MNAFGNAFGEKTEKKGDDMMGAFGDAFGKKA